MTPYESAIEELERRIVEMIKYAPAGLPDMDNEARGLYHDELAAHARQIAELCTALAAMHKLAASDVRRRPEPDLTPTKANVPLRKGLPPKENP